MWGLALVAFAGVGCSSSGSSGGGGTVAAVDAGGGGGLDTGAGGDGSSTQDTGKDTATTCTVADDHCDGDQVVYCDVTTGKIDQYGCSNLACQQAGYKSYAGCGMSSSGLIDCLCETCTSADNKCLGTSSAQVCDSATGKLSITTCASGKNCVNGKCVTATCVPSCKPGVCGPQTDGCGGSCSCPSGEQCNSGVCKKPCTAADQSCTGNTLHYCGPDGNLVDKQCSDASCQLVGYPSYSNCGANPGQNATCLCNKCTDADNKCFDGKTVQTCDNVTGTLTKTTCTGVNVCYGGACVDPTCKPSCDGTTCGPDSDGCGGTCNCGGGNLCDKGYCVAPCSDFDNYCLGSTLTYCGQDGLMASKTCSAASCLASGYVAYDSCGKSSKGYDACLCKPCTVADNTCVDTKTAQVCDTVTGKMSNQVCAAGATCKAGACQVVCATNADCASDQYCVKSTGVCKAYDGASYEMEIKWADVVGDYGDTPDPYAQVVLNGTIVCTTPTLSDTYVPVWFAVCPSKLTLKSTDTLAVWLYDSDAVFDDTIGGSNWTGSALAALMKLGTYLDGTIGSSGTTITFSLKPQ